MVHLRNIFTEVTLGLGEVKRLIDLRYINVKYFFYLGLVGTTFMTTESTVCK